MSTAAPMQHTKAETAKPAQQTSQLAAQSQHIDTRETQHEFADQRPQAATQRKLHNAAKHSPQSRQFQAVQQMAQHSARSTQLKTMSAMMNAPALQRAEDKDPLQTKTERTTVQREAAASTAPKLNKTGLPDNLKSGIESLSGISMDHVKVHYNSSQPAQLNAHAYAQGSEIHVAPGQEQHLSHEAWHVVQQAQGRVKPTMQMKGGVLFNDHQGLEREADMMGTQAESIGNTTIKSTNVIQQKQSLMTSAASVVQRFGPSYIPLGNGPHANIHQSPSQAGVKSFDNAADDFYAGLPATLTNTITLAGDIDSYANDAPMGPDLVRTRDMNAFVGQIDHIVPQSLGGGTSFINAQLVDADSNLNKGNTYPCPISGLRGTRVFLGTGKWDMPAGTILNTDYANARIQIDGNAKVPKTEGVTLFNAPAAPVGTAIDSNLSTLSKFYVPNNDGGLVWISYAQAQANGLAPTQSAPLQ